MKNIINNLSDCFLKENKLIFKKYKPLKKIGQGSFGNVYSVVRLIDKTIFAMKTEKKNAEIPFLKSEAFTLLTLQGFGIPKLISYGTIKNYKILIQQLLDKSLHEIFTKDHRIAPLLDVCLIGIQILDRLEWIHSKNYIYKDIKTSNFMIGIKDPNVIYVIDFGLCKKYRSSKTGKHILQKKNSTFDGTVKYLSNNVIRGKEPSRRDDLVSLGYMLIYLLKGELPWDFFRNLNREEMIQIIRLKDNNGEGKLFNDLPEEMINYIKYTRNLKFEENPDYNYLRSLFQGIILKKKDSNYKNLTFSWIHFNHNKLKGFPKNFSLKKSNSHTRLFKKIKESSLNKKAGQYSQDIYKSNLNIFMLTGDNNLYSPINKNSLNDTIKKKILDYKNKNINNSVITSQDNNIIFVKKSQEIKNPNLEDLKGVKKQSTLTLIKGLKTINISNKIIKQNPILSNNKNFDFNINIKNNIFKNDNNNNYKNENKLISYPMRNINNGLKKNSLFKNISNIFPTISNNMEINKRLLFKGKKLRTNYISPIRKLKSAINKKKNISMPTNLINQNNWEGNIYSNKIKTSPKIKSINDLTKNINQNDLELKMNHFKNNYKKKAINIYFINNNILPKKTYNSPLTQKFQNLKFQNIKNNNIYKNIPNIKNKIDNDYYRYVSENNLRIDSVNAY